MSAKAATADAPAAAAAAGGASKLPMIMLGMMVVANLGGTGVIAMRLLKGTPATKEVTVKEKTAAAGPGPVIALDTFVVNLNEPGSSRYLKTTFEIEVADAVVQKEVEENRRGLRDELLRYLSNLTIKDTLGEAGKQKIKEDLLERSNKALGDHDKVKHLYFTEFVVQ